MTKAIAKGYHRERTCLYCDGGTQLTADWDSTRPEGQWLRWTRTPCAECKGRGHVIVVRDGEGAIR